MKKVLLVQIMLVLIAGLIGCSNEDNPPSPPPVSDYLQLEESSVLLDDEGVSTIQVMTSFDLADGTSLYCYKLSESGDTITADFEISSVKKGDNSSWQVVLSDKGETMAYDEKAVLVYEDVNTSSSFSSDPFNVRKRFFTGLPVVMIVTPDSANVTSKEDWMKNTRMSIYDEQGALNYEGDLAIKGRGNTTWSAPKKPYALKLDSKSEILGMPKHKRWVLLANYLDKTLMRNHIAFFIAKAKGISLEWTPRGTFVDLVLNGKHLGNYYLCEQIKIDENRVNVHENEPDDIDGGYLLELDTYYDEVNKFRTPFRKLPVMFKEPDEDDLTPAQFEYVKDYFAKVENALYADDSQKTGNYKDLIDVNTFVDFWFVNEVTGCDESSWPKSCYMHKDKGGKLKAGPVWDYDYATFGKFYGKFITNKYVWNDQILADPEVMALARERWQMLMPEFMKVADEIDRLKEILEKSAEVNEKMWPITGSNVNGDEKLPFGEAADLMKKNLMERLNWIDMNL